MHRNVRKEYSLPVQMVLLLVLVLTAMLLWDAQDLHISRQAAQLWQNAEQRHEAGQISVVYDVVLAGRVIGLLPVFGGLLILGWSLVCGEGIALWQRSRLHDPLGWLVGALLLAVGCQALICTGLHRLTALEIWCTPVWLRILLGLVVFVVLLAHGMYSVCKAVRRRGLQRLGVCWCSLALAQGLLSQLMCWIWPRSAFDELGTDAVGFALWTALPGGPGHSFPSKEVSCAAVLLVLVLACRWLPECRGEEGPYLFFGLGIAALVGFAQVLTGEAYFTDCCMAILVDMSLLLLIIFYLSYKDYKNTTNGKVLRGRKAVLEEVK